MEDRSLTSQLQKWLFTGPWKLKDQENNNNAVNRELINILEDVLILICFAVGAVLAWAHVNVHFVGISCALRIVLITTMIIGKRKFSNSMHTICIMLFHSTPIQQ